MTYKILGGGGDNRQVPDNVASDSPNIPEDGDNPLDKFRFGSTETILVSNIPEVDDLVIAPGEGTMSILMDENISIPPIRIYNTTNIGDNKDRFTR